ADSGARTVQLWPNDRINSLFEATVDATEEAIANAMVAAETMTGANGLRVFALPRDRVVESLRTHGRIGQSRKP
ncbi:MAG TPA: P1 family peptidase, partial [Gemmatimonadales bacterium]|nr:P1 family peptidase [Gemmatimonadales bacterium]